MSRGRTGRPDYPIDFKNEIGAALTAFSIFKSASSGTVNNARYLIAAEPAADGDEALFVSGNREIADDGYGKCRTVFDSPFWVRYEGSAPSAGNTVGPVASETYVDTTGTGFKVLAVDTTNLLVLCAALGGGACDCVTVHEIRYEGAVTSGTVSFSVAIWTDDTPTVDTDTLVLNWDDTAAEVQTTWETHSGIAASGVDIIVIGGPLPSVAVYIVFLSTGALNRHHPLPVPTSSLVGTNARCKVAYMGDANWEAEA